MTPDEIDQMRARAESLIRDAGGEPSHIAQRNYLDHMRRFRRSTYREWKAAGVLHEAAVIAVLEELREIDRLCALGMSAQGARELAQQQWTCPPSEKDLRDEQRRIEANMRDAEERWATRMVDALASWHDKRDEN